MKNKTLLLLIFITAMLVLAGCSGSMMTPVSWPGTVSDGETVFIAHGSFVYAVDAEDGKEIWRFPSEKADKAISFFASPVLAEDQLITGDYTNILYSFDPANGSTNWTFDMAEDRYADSPLVLDDMLYAPSADGNLYALDMNGNYEWSFEKSESFWAKPVTDGENLYVSSMDHNLYAVSLDGGRELWSYDLEGAAVSGPLLDNGTLYAGSLAKQVVAIDKDSGRKIWSFVTNDGVWGTPVATDGLVVFADSTGNIYAVEAESGKLNWNAEISSTITGSGVFFEEGVIFTTEDGNIVEIDLDGKKKTWGRTVDGKLYSTPIIVNNTLIVGVTDGADGLLALAFDFNGNEVWSFTPEK